MKQIGIQFLAALISNIATTELCLMIGTDVYWRGFLVGAISCTCAIGAGQIYVELRKHV